MKNLTPSILIAILLILTPIVEADTIQIFNYKVNTKGEDTKVETNPDGNSLEGVKELINGLTALVEKAEEASSCEKKGKQHVVKKVVTTSDEEQSSSSSSSSSEDEKDGGKKTHNMVKLEKLPVKKVTTEVITSSGKGLSSIVK